MSRYIAAIDQGTTSTRCILFDHEAASPIATAQKEHRQFYPRPGWVEHDPIEIWQRTCDVVRDVLRQAGVRPGEVAAVGITNQRETTVLWDRRTGRPIGNAIVWQDTRTADFCNDLAAAGGQDRFRHITGLPLATYFSGPKIRWMIDEIPGALEAARAGDVLFGTVDTWLIWNLTGGTDGGVHLTDVTNASRTSLMDLATLDWHQVMLDALGVPRAMLPRILPSVPKGGFGMTRTDGPFGEALPIGGCLGDQQAALMGQTCFVPGESKNTYGTGCFMLLNTGTQIVPSTHGLLTTVGYQIRDEPAVYALEGSVAMAGSLVQWVRDNLGLIARSSEIETLAMTVRDNGGVYFVPAFAGLFAPHWRSDARGVVAGLTGYANKGHLARAVLEATAYQTRDVLDAMRKDAGVDLKALRVDGGMTANELLMQFQSDLLGVPVIRPTVRETTALGAAYAAGLSVGFWNDTRHLAKNWKADKTWTPAMLQADRDALHRLWLKAVERSMGWES